MPTPDDYYYEPGQRPYYTPAAYRPPPRDPRDNVDPNATTYQPVPEGPATPGAGDPGARSGRRDYHGTMTPFARSVLASGQPMPTSPGATPPAQPDQPPPTPASYGVDPSRGFIFPPQVAAVPPVPRPMRDPPLPPGSLTPPSDVQPPNRFWNPVAPQQPFADQINRYSHEYGIPPNLLSNLLRAESGFDPRATGPMTKYGQAGGIAQFIPATAARYHINPYDPDQGIRGAAEYLRDLYNEKGTWAGAVAAYNGSKTIDTSQYRGSPAGRALIANAVALDGGLVRAGPLVPPPQNYRPESYGQNRWTPDRPPSQWGRDTPDMFSGIGAIPHQREIPGIMKALAPLLMVGLSLFSKGAALPMLSFYGGYLKASAAKQDKDAKELKTKYQDQLKELKAKMGIELAAYGGAGGDMSELRNLAVEFGDQTLLGILDAGKDPGPLLQQRDRIFKDTSKTDLAERRQLVTEEKFAVEQQKWYLEQQEKNEMDPLKKQELQQKIAERDRKAKELEKRQNEIGGEQTPDPGEGEQPTEEKPEAPAESPPAAAPAAPGDGAPASSPSPAPEAAPEPAAPSTPPAGGTPAGETPTPAAPPPVPGRQGAATPGGPPDQVVDAQGNAVAPRSDIQPAVYRGEQPAATPAAATTTPAATLPDQEVGALPPANLAAPYRQDKTGLSPERLDQDARAYLENQRDQYHGTSTSGDPLAAVRNEAVRRRAAQMQSYIDRVIANTPKGHIDDALQKIATVDPGMASIAKAVDTGDMAPPSGWQLQKPFYQNIQKLVTSVDPAWNQTRWVTNYRTKVAYDTGTQGIQIASINRALQHMTILRDAATQLKNTNYPDWNALVNGVRTHLGSDAATNFTSARTAVSRELERAFRGSGGAWGEIQHDLEIANSSGSPEQIAGYIRTTTELLKGQLDALADLYSRGTRTNTRGEDLLSPEARATFDHIMHDPLDGKVGEAGGPPTGAAEIEQPMLDNTATYPPQGMGGPGPAPNEPAVNNWSATPEQ